MKLADEVARPTKLANNVIRPMKLADEVSRPTKLADKVIGPMKLADNVQVKDHITLQNELHAMRTTISRTPHDRNVDSFVSTNRLFAKL